VGTLTDRVRAGDLDAVRAALAAGESPDSLEPDTGLTALACAVDEARLDLVELLLDAGADVEGGRPIGHAARDRTAILARLLRAGADPNPRPGEDPPPLYAAVADVEAVALLLDHGIRTSPPRSARRR
jgi:ankyrin repeat protein